MLNKTESGCWLSEAEQYYAVGRIYVCVNLCVCVYTYEYMHTCTGMHTYYSWVQLLTQTRVWLQNTLTPLEVGRAEGVALPSTLHGTLAKDGVHETEWTWEQLKMEIQINHFSRTKLQTGESFQKHPEYEVAYPSLARGYQMAYTSHPHSQHKKNTKY